MCLNDDLLALTFSYLDITTYPPAEIQKLFTHTGCINPDKILNYWEKSTLYKTITTTEKTIKQVNGKIHRLDGPAIEWSNGHKEWWLNDKRHRLDGPAIEWSHGKQWWVNNKLHRSDGPAVERSNGDNEWWVDGKKHRSDGPAVEWADGGKEWWV